MQYRDKGADTKRREQIEQASNRMSILLCRELYGIHVDAKGLEGCGMEQALAYVCCPETDSRVRLQKHCRKIYELGYVPICPRFGFCPFWMKQARRICRECPKCPRSCFGGAGW